MMLGSPGLQFTHDGNRIAMLDGDGVAVATLDGTRRWIAVERPRELAAFGDQVWTLGAAGLERWAFDGRSLGAPIALDGSLAPALTGPAAATAGDRAWLDDLGTLRELPVAGDAAFVFAGRRHVIATAGEIRLGAAR